MLSPGALMLSPEGTLTASNQYKKYLRCPLCFWKGAAFQFSIEPSFARYGLAQGWSDNMQRTCVRVGTFLWFGPSWNPLWMSLQVYW